MTWLSTWPRYGRPEYAEHTSEAAAEAHAIEVVRSGIAPHATAYQLDDLTVLPDEGTQP